MENGNNEVSVIRELAITKQLNVLLGSGTSVPAMPLMKMIHEDDKKESNKILLNAIKEISSKVVDSEYSIDFDVFEKVEGYKKDEIERSIETTSNNYYNFLVQIINLLEKSNSRQVPRSVNIFTTNYDLFIEHTIDRLSAERRFVFNDGARGYFNRYLDSSNYNRVVSYKGLNDNYIDEIPSINLIKPHGSVNWGKLNNGKIVIKGRVEAEPVVVRPTGREEEETFLSDYFHEMLRMFQLELDKPQSLLLVIGFSFQDKHIAKMVKRALENRELMVYVFCFNEEDKNNIMNNLSNVPLPNNMKIVSPNEIYEEHQELIIDNNEHIFTIANLTKLLEVK